MDYYKITFLFLEAFILYEIRQILFAGSSHSTYHTQKKINPISNERVNALMCV